MLPVRVQYLNQELLDKYLTPLTRLTYKTKSVESTNSNTQHYRMQWHVSTHMHLHSLQETKTGMLHHAIGWCERILHERASMCDLPISFPAIICSRKTLAIYLHHLYWDRCSEKCMLNVSLNLWSLKNKWIQSIYLGS
jgi:hypothetical protein